MRISNLFLRAISIVLACTSSLSAQLSCQAFKSAMQPPLYYNAENLRSDTFDILKYTITLEIGNTINKNIIGNTQVRFNPKLNNRTFIRLDLLKLIVDSVKEGNTALTYYYNDTVLRINFSAPKNTIDTSIITVYYKGVPQGDPSGWGGFYYDNTQSAQYAYNLGVGFGARPHNYGRVWFPCFDNFVEKSKYEFNITCDSIRRSYCNGTLVSDQITGAKRTRKWVINEQIPSYLASVAVANYTHVNWNVNTLTGNKPIWLVAYASDTTAMKAGFVNLKSCINGFESYFGPYKWNRFGYCLVPFNSGAMEHATNISYPRLAIGNLGYEAELMAHELSHHWWGDLVTCEAPEDMWINEGMATFSSYMFLEWQYGKTTYLNKVKTEHDNLLHFLHKKEGFRAISGVPHSLTYGDHVYRKGADVAHTLRGYMGDVAFFNACKYAMQQKSYKNANSLEFRDLLQAASGQNLSSFFSDWVLTKGWPHFAIDSVKYVQNSPTNVDATVFIKQKLFGAPGFYSNVPLELSFFKSDWSKDVKLINMSGGVASFTINLGFDPVYCALNYDSKINDATSHEVKIIKSVVNQTYALGKVFMLVQNKGADSSLVRVVHNYVRPDPFKNNPIYHKLSDQHFWKVEGILSPGFASKIRFNYDGYKGASGTYIYMDTLLTLVNGDSVALFYRKDAADDWRWLKNVTKVKVNAKSGYIESDSLWLGEYTFGNFGDTASVGLMKLSPAPISVNVYPSPAGQKINIELGDRPVKSTSVSIYSLDGKLISETEIYLTNDEISVAQLPRGAYLIKIQSQGKLIHSQKLVLE